ncbi:MAG: penicillin-binding protein 2 [Hyphomicrobiaceae bacterium]|nr:penicillin-binding protein 2 [Hyphomicrobiaceae bacterium]
MAVQPAPQISLEGSRKSALGQARSRLALIVATVALVYAAIGGRLVQLAGSEAPERVRSASVDLVLSAARPDIVDRNGELLATDVPSIAIVADPAVMVDPAEAVDSLGRVLPEIDRETLLSRFTSDSRFAWVAREVTPPMRDAVHHLGIPGIAFRDESRRFYPGGPTAAHILGAVNVDHVGISGIERMLNDTGIRELQTFGLVGGGEAEALAPVRLSIDLRVQHAVRDELQQAMQRYSAAAAVGIVMDVTTGEIVAMVSVPDFDPNNRAEAIDNTRFNRASDGAFELGSVMKVFTIAAALDAGAVDVDDSFDARNPIQIGSARIGDFHGRNRFLTVPEVFIYSSNIGTIRIAQQLGTPGLRAYFERFHLTTRLDFDINEVATPVQPREWTALDAAVASFGHAMTTTPLQVAAAGAAVINGGTYYPPTLYPRSAEEARAVGEQVLSPEVSALMRSMFRLNVERGSGRRAAAEGFDVGGKTGTAEKIVNGAYDENVRINSFLAGFPMSDPRYVVMVTIDEPQPEEGQRYATAGLNAAPTVGAIIRRIGPMLQIGGGIAGMGDGAVRITY